jgi:cardiolipin synthase
LLHQRPDPTASFVTLNADVRVYDEPSTLHAKTFVVDGQWSTIGSMNFDNRSMALDDESTLKVLDPTFGRQMDQIFPDDLRHAEEITLATFQRSWWERLMEQGANFRNAAAVSCHSSAD